MTVYELLTLIGLISGPIAAVVITLWWQARSQKRDLRIQIAKTLMGTRHLPADAAYNGAINLIPIEFNDNVPIMTAWREYMEAVRYQPSPENEKKHDEVISAKQSTLIYRILKHLRYDVSESDIRVNAYASRGFVWREGLMLDAWAAWPRIAKALESQVETLQQIEPVPASQNPERLKQG